MERVIIEWLDATTWPVYTAVLLGLLTAVSPCPLATNITAMGYIGKDLENRRKVFFNGLWYTLGTIASYTLLATIIYLGADQLEVSGVFQRYGVKIMGPLLVFMGLVLSGLLPFRMPDLLNFTRYVGRKGVRNYFDAFFLGAVFALAFCPNTGVMYFGMLVPLTINTPYGLYLPFVFALTSAVPVVVFAYLIAFTIHSVGSLYGRITLIENWFRKAVAISFVISGLFLVYKVYF